MIELTLENEFLAVRLNDCELKPRVESQLAFWGFTRSTDSGFVAANHEPADLVVKVATYLERQGVQFQKDVRIQAVLAEQQLKKAELANAIERCRQLKSGCPDPTVVETLTAFLCGTIKRSLKEHQFKAALHLVTAENGANFSVPGSGKTTVVIAVFEFLRKAGLVDSLFVVGPPACFAPWQSEFESVLGRKPTCDILAGGVVDHRRIKYLVDQTSTKDLFLTTFQTLQRDWEHVSELFRQQNLRFFLVVDEAHYIKQVDGQWANAVLKVARHASRRCVLSGTPFPRSYSDGFNLFDVLWPGNSPIGVQDRHRIEFHSGRNDFAEAAVVLNNAIGPLFYRVRKQDLDLAPQYFHEPIRIRMNQHERTIYDAILDRIEYASQSDFFRDFDLLVRLRRGRMIRLRQCASFIPLLKTALVDYTEDLISLDPSLAEIIQRYEENEIPAKIVALQSLVEQIRTDSKKIVIWSNFVPTLKMITQRAREWGYGARLIYGGTPFERMDIREELSREAIIRDFIDPESGTDILVANPAACAESISLHKSCSHAVYYDLSYNCAQYLQSLDRIHRVGGSEDKPAHYYFLQYTDTLDADVLMNLRAKALNMQAIIDQDYPLYSLDMFTDDEDAEAYERLFGKPKAV